jgi:NAD(P)-dependent dehydrogenase (short-subunit alcohol dehydrogenase family)
MGGYLEGRVEVVTGGGRGIGRAIAIALAAQGARVVVADYGGALDSRLAGSSATAEAVVTEITGTGGEAVACAEDVASMEGSRRIIETAVDAFGRLDGMVCCAGIMVQKYLWDMDEKDWDDVIGVHLKGHFGCAQAAARVMMPRRSGRLLFISSGSYAGIANQPSYSAAKAGILGFTWSCASALFPYGITTNCVVPSAATRMSDKTLSEYIPLSEQAGEAVKSERAGGTYRDPANIAPLVVYLLSDAGADVNGQVFRAVGYQIDRLGDLAYDRTMTSDGPWDLDALFERFTKEMGPDLMREPLPWPPPGR